MGSMMRWMTASGWFANKPSEHATAGLPCPPPREYNNNNFTFSLPPGLLLLYGAQLLGGIHVV